MIGSHRMCHQNLLIMVTLQAILLAGAASLVGGTQCNSSCASCEQSRCVCYPGYGSAACDFSLFTVFGRHTPHVYGRGLAVHPLDAHGWCLTEELYKKLAQLVDAQTIVEVGVWKGATSLWFARFLAEKGHGVVLSVDTFLGSLEHWEHSRLLSLRHGHPSIYHIFMSNVVHMNLTRYVIPFPVQSRTAAEFVSKRNLQADLIHVDAGHGYADCFEDMKLWWEMVRPGGILMGDDYNWPGVEQAVNEFVASHNLQLNTTELSEDPKNPGIRCRKWWIHKPL